MKNKYLTILLAAALCAPQVAFAARDNDGMEYVSASEGFYGSIRTVFKSKDGGENNGSSIGADSSRLGVRGSLDLGRGLTGLYRYEWAVSGDNGENVGTTRLSYVGLRGSWGEFQAGSVWDDGYNWVTSATDIASTGSGNFVPGFRSQNTFKYTSPDINGFQAGFRVVLDGDRDGDIAGDIAAPTSANVVSTLNANTAAAYNALESEISAYSGPGGWNRGDSFIEGQTINFQPRTVSEGNTITASYQFDYADNAKNLNVNAKPADDRNLDLWEISGKYKTRGFTFAGLYRVEPDVITNPGGSFVIRGSNNHADRIRGFPAGLNSQEIMMAVSATLATIAVTRQTDGDEARRLLNQHFPFVQNGTVAQLAGINRQVSVLAAPQLDTTKEDATFWALRTGYGQDNWNVNMWYGEHNTSEHNRPIGRFTDGGLVNDTPPMQLSGNYADGVEGSPVALTGTTPKGQDTKIFSIAGDIAIEKWNVVGIFETMETRWGQKDNVVVLNVDYKFTSRSKAYLAYIARDYDPRPTMPMN